MPTAMPPDTGQKVFPTALIFISDFHLQRWWSDFLKMTMKDLKTIQTLHVLLQLYLDMWLLKSPYKSESHLEKGTIQLQVRHVKLFSICKFNS